MYRLWEGAAGDVRIALRGFRRSPLFTIVVVAILSLGLGANTAIFNLVNTLLLRSIAAVEPGRLVSLSTLDSGREPGGFSYSALDELRRNQQVLSSLFGWTGGGIRTVEVEKTLAPASVIVVTPEYYSVLGLVPELGRTFGPGAATETASSATVSYRFWQNRLGGRPDVIGKTIRIDGRPYSIAAVMPERFHGYTIGIPEDVTVALPAWFDAARLREPRRGIFDIMGRLKPGMTLAQAREQLQAVWPSILAATVPPEFDASQRKDFLSIRISVDSGAQGGATDYVRRRYARHVLLLMGAVGLMLLIACANIAGLLLSRAAARSHDISVRIALGAGRWRLLRQPIAEALLLSMPAIGIAALLGSWLSRKLADFMWINVLPHDLALQPDARVYAFLAAAALVTAFLSGSVPAWNVPRTAPAAVLYGLGRGGGTARRQGFARALVAAQSALALVLLTAAALFGTSLNNIRDADLGFDTEPVLAVQLTARPNGYDDSFKPVPYYREMLERMRQLPGVRSATLSKYVPVMPAPFNYRERVVTAGTGAEGRAYRHDDAPRFFETFGIRILRGRDFAFTDAESATPYAIVSTSLAAQLFPREEAIGRTISVGSAPEWQRAQVIGVAADANLWNVRNHAPPLVYVSLFQEPDRMGSSMLEVRAAGSATGVAGDVRHVLDAMGREYPLLVESLEKLIDRTLIQERMMAALAGFFGVFPLALACLGLYGLVSYSVSRRTAEIGVRMALGAGRAGVFRMVILESLSVVGAGVAAGIPLALIAARFARGMLYEVSPADPRLLAISAAALMATAVIAAVVPAIRATRIDPIAALRVE